MLLHDFVDRSKDGSMSEEVDHMSSAISRCNENMQLKRELMVKNDRAMQDGDYQVPLKGGRWNAVRGSVALLKSSYTLLFQLCHSLPTGGGTLSGGRALMHSL